MVWLTKIASNDPILAYIKAMYMYITLPKYQLHSYNTFSVTQTFCHRPNQKFLAVNHYWSERFSTAAEETSPTGKPMGTLIKSP